MLAAPAAGATDKKSLGSAQTRQGPSPWTSIH